MTVVDWTTKPTCRGRRAAPITRTIPPPPKPKRCRKPLQHARHPDRPKDARDRGQGKHEPDHDPGKVPRQGAVDDHEDGGIGRPLVEEPQSHGGERYEDVEVEVEGGPGCRLVLGDGRDNGDVPEQQQQTNNRKGGEKN